MVSRGLHFCFDEDDSWDASLVAGLINENVFITVHLLQATVFCGAIITFSKASREFCFEEESRPGGFRVWRHLVALSLSLLFFFLASVPLFASVLALRRFVIERRDSAAPCVTLQLTAITRSSLFSLGHASETANDVSSELSEDIQVEQSADTARRPAAAGSQQTFIDALRNITSRRDAHEHRRRLDERATDRLSVRARGTHDEGALQRSHPRRDAFGRSSRREIESRESEFAQLGRHLHPASL